MNEDEKRDKIPEVWEGHNIADFIDPGIMKVSVCFCMCTKACKGSRCWDSADICVQTRTPTVNASSEQARASYKMNGCGYLLFTAVFVFFHKGEVHIKNVTASRLIWGNLLPLTGPSAMPRNKGHKLLNNENHKILYD